MLDYLRLPMSINIYFFSTTYSFAIVTPKQISFRIILPINRLPQRKCNIG